MSLSTAAGAKFFIAVQSGAPIPAKPANLSAFAAHTYQEVGEVEDAGEIGDTSEAVTFTSLGGNRTVTLKGPRSGGESTLVCGSDPEDVGQDMMRAAYLEKFDYAFKFVEDNALTDGGAGEISYFFGKVMNERKGIGAASNVTKRNFSVAINSGITPVKPT